VNTDSHVRLPDQDCQPLRDAVDGWVYYHSGSTIPAIGAKADAGTTDADGDQVKQGGVPAQGVQSGGDDGTTDGGGVNIGGGGGGSSGGGDDDEGE
jgi:hypothetical protein